MKPDAARVATRRLESALFRVTPEEPLLQRVETRVGPVGVVRAFYCDVLNPQQRGMFDKFDVAWRRAFPYISRMEFNEDSAEIWVYVPHPRLQGEAERPYGMPQAKWNAFLNKWRLFIAPDLPSQLRP